MSIRRIVPALVAIVASVVGVPTGAQAYRVQGISGISATATSVGGTTVYAYSRTVADVSDSGPLGAPYPSVGSPSALVVTNALDEVVCVAEPLATFSADPLGLTVSLTSTVPGCSADLTWSFSGPPMPGVPSIGPEGPQLRITTPSNVTGVLRGSSFSAEGSTSRNLALFVTA